MVVRLVRGDELAGARVAVIKLLWLAIRDIEDKRARAREKDRGKPASQRIAPGRLVEGGTVQGWNAAINALSINPTY